MGEIKFSFQLQDFLLGPSFSGKAREDDSS